MSDFHLARTFFRASARFQSNREHSFILSALAQKAFSDGDLSKAIALARQVVSQGSTLPNGSGDTTQ